MTNLPKPLMKGESVKRGVKEFLSNPELDSRIIQSKAALPKTLDFDNALN